MTMGTSPMIARPMFSEYRLIPGPLVAVRTRRPVMAAPMQKPSEAISSSPWMATPPMRGRSRIMLSRIGVAGVIG